MGVKIKGLGPVKKRVSRLSAELGPRVQEGVEAGAEIGRERSHSLTPVEEGELRASYRVVSERVGKSSAIALLANDAEHAAWVHEATQEKLRGQKRPGGRKGHYWDGGESKFMEKGVFNNRREIIREIQRVSRWQKV